jgi:hypothetical protein
MNLGATGKGGSGLFRPERWGEIPFLVPCDTQSLFCNLEVAY